jgi:PKD repeat protein
MDFNVQTIALAAQVQAFSMNTALPIYTIDWGDGSPTQQASTALHAYAMPGIYEICVQMYDADPTLPCELYQCQEVEITGNGTECPVNLQVVPDNMSAVATITGGGGATADYFIDWGDGSFSANPITQHEYANPGVYEVCVYYGVNGNIGCQSSACVQIIIDPLGDCYFDFVATVSGLDVELQVLAAGADNPLFFMDWGDGTSGETTLPPSHSYSAAGTYDICGQYSDSLNPAGCQLSTCITVTLTDNTGGCTVALNVVQSGNQVQATALGTGAVVPSYTIDWRDGSLPIFDSTGAHTYSNGGAYEICVTYSDSANAECSVTTCETVVITGVEESSVQRGIRVWPNPMNDQLFIQLPESFTSDIRLRLLDSTGRVVLAKTLFSPSADNRIALQVDALSKGVYVLEFSSDYATNTFRLLK